MKFFKKKDGVYVAIGSLLLVNFLGLLGVLMIDQGNALFGGIKHNFLASIVTMLSIKRINIGTAIFCGFAMTYVATVLPVILLIFAKKIRKLLEKKIPAKHSKWIVWAVCAAIFVFGWTVVLAFFALKNVKIRYLFLTHLYFLIAQLIVSVCLLVIYMIIEIFSHAFKPNIKTETTVNGNGAVTAPSVASVGESAKAENKGEIFPSLKAIDAQYAKKSGAPAQAETDYTLPQIAEGFQAFLSERCALYYDLKMLRSFIAGMATSRLIILEGLSGTGKSSLPRYFSEYVGSKTFFAPVQSTWRDRSDVLGFYNDFSYVFKETNFLKRLYEASYIPNQFNIMVLDEMNLSRVEYYFADFLSVLEYPAEDWKVTVMPAVKAELSPKKLDNGAVVVPVNTWFVGTANKDDSTFTITDKVYDRAVVLEFNDKNAKIQTKASPEPIALGPTQLSNLFQTAKERAEFGLAEGDIAKFDELAEFVYELFEIRFGNRIMNQIMNFVPVYVALGGTKEEAIDLMFCRKVLHKLDGRFEDYIKEGLVRLQNKINQLYGAGVLADTENMIRRLVKKLS